MTRVALRVFLAVLVLLAAALTVLLTSDSVARWLVNRGVQMVPALSLTYRGGDLWSGITVTELRYAGAGVEVAAEQAAVRWSLQCLVAGNVCLDRIRADGVVVRIRPAADESGDSAAGSSPAMPVLPVDILFPDAGVDRLTVDTPQVKVSVAAIRVRGSLTNGALRLAEADVDEPVVTLAESDPATTESSQPGPIALPSIVTPLPVRVDALRLESPAVVTGGQRYQARFLSLQAALAGQQLTLGRLHLAHEQGELELSGRLRLDGDYPLALQVRASAPKLYDGKPLRVQAELANNLADLGVKARISGLVEARLDGRLQPLDPSVPYRATLRSDRAGWPPLSEPQMVRAHGLRLQVEGDLSGYQLSGFGALAGTQVPELDWRIEAAGDWTQADIQRLTLAGLDGTAVLSGQVHWSPSVEWRAEVTAEGLQLQRRWPQAPAAVTGRAQVTGGLAESGWRLTVDTPGIAADYQGQRLSAKGRVRHDADGTWRVNPLVVEDGANRVRLTGRYNGGLDLNAELDLPEPQRWLAGLAGAAKGSVTVQGPLQAPDIQGQIRARRLSYQQTRVDEVELDAQVAGLGEARSQVTLRASGVARDGRQLGDLSLTIIGTRGDHRLTLGASGEVASVEMALVGGLQLELDWQGRLAEGRVVWGARRWVLAEPAELAFDRQRLQARLSPHCWQGQETSLCLSEPARLGPSGQVAVALEEMPLGWLSQWLPEGFAWSGRISGLARAAWGPDTPPRLEAALVSRDGSLSVIGNGAAGATETGLPLGYQRLTVDADLNADRLEGRIEMTSETVGELDIRFRLRHALPERPLDGSVRVEGVKVAALAPFFPRIETLGGELAVVGDVGGTLTSPAFNGEVRLRDGEIQGPELPMHVEQLRLTARIEGRQADLEGSFVSGGEQAQLTGSADWAGRAWSLEVHLEGERLRVQYPPIAVVRVSPDLKLEASAEQVTLSGRIRVPEGELTLKQLPKGAVAYSPDVVIVRGPGVKPKLSDGQGGGALTVKSNIEVVLGDEVRFSGLGAEGRLTGGLRLRQVGASTTEATGEIRIVDASFEAYGQELDIRSGRLIFAGPVTEPLVEIEAVRQVESVVVGLRVDGPASQPEITLFSEPPMPEEQILSYLVTGRAYGEAGPGEDAAMAQAAVALGVFTSRGAASDIASELGIQDFQLAAEGEGEGTQVTVSGYIAPNLLVKYGVGVFTPENTLTLRYNVTRNVYLEAVSGIESAIDAFYTFSF